MIDTQTMPASDADAGRAHDRSERAVVEARNAVQWLARVTRSYAPGCASDITLLFDPATRHVVTPEIGPGIRLALDLAHLTFQFEDNGTPTPHALDVDDRSSAEVEAWLLAELLHRGFDRERFDKRLPYEWPNPMSGDEVRYAAHDLAYELDRLARRLVIAAAGLVDAEPDARTRGDAEPFRRASIPFFPDSFTVGYARSSSASFA